MGALATAALAYASVRHQAHHQRLSEHQKSLREERRVAYLGFWNAAFREVNEYRDFLINVQDFLDDRGMEPDWDERRNWYAPRTQALFELDQLRTVVALVGPPSVAEAADHVLSGLIDASLSVRDLVERRDPEEWVPKAVKAALKRIESGHDIFITEARSVMTNVVQG